MLHSNQVKWEVSKLFFSSRRYFHTPVYEASPGSSRWGRCSACHQSPHSRPCSVPSSLDSQPDTLEDGSTDKTIWGVVTLGSVFYFEWGSTYFPEDCVDTLPQRMVVLDWFADFSHLLQQTTFQKKSPEKLSATLTVSYTPPWRPQGSPLRPPSLSLTWKPWSKSWWACGPAAKRSSRSAVSQPGRSRAAAPARTGPRCWPLWSRSFGAHTWTTAQF